MSGHVAAFDAQGLASADGAASTAAWLRAYTRCDTVAGSRMVRTARMLEVLPLLASRFADGIVGAEHMSAVAGGAARVPDEVLALSDKTFADFAGVARPSEFHRVAKRVAACHDEEAVARDAEAAYERRHVSLGQTFGGVFHLAGQLDPEGGAALQAALESLMTPMGREDGRSAGQRRADALVELTGVALRSAELPDCGGERPRVTFTAGAGMLGGALAGAGALGGTAGGALGGVAAADAAAGGGPGPDPGLRLGPGLGLGLGLGLGDLSGSAVAVGVFGHGDPHLLGNGALVPVETIRRMCCDADLNVVLQDCAGEVLHYGRSRRSHSPAQRRAVVLRDGGCVFPHCDRPPAHCQVHHVTYWSQDGSTDLDNLALVCLFHHHLLHEGGWSIEKSQAALPGSTGTHRVVSWTARGPDGRVLQQQRRPPA